MKTMKLWRIAFVMLAAFSIASFLSPTVVTHPQGRHVFGEIIPNIHKTPEHLFRLSPRQTLFHKR